MPSGDNALKVHLVTTCVVFYSVLVSWLFYPCVASEEPSGCLPFIKWIEKTAIFPVFIEPAMLLALILVFVKTLVVLPYVVLYWCRRFKDSTKNERFKGLILTSVALSLVIIDPCMPFGFSNGTRNYLSNLDSGVGVLGYFITILSIYIIPCLFIHLGSPDIKQRRHYRLYLVSISVQVFFFLLAVIGGIFLWP